MNRFSIVAWVHASLEINLCIDVTDGQITPGTDGQITPGTDGQITPGTTIQLWSCHGGANQKFKLSWQNPAGGLSGEPYD
jgi:hypothetical protein